MVARANPQSFPSWYKYDLPRNSLAIQVSQFWLTKYHQVVSLKHAIYDGSVKVAHLSRVDLLPGKERMFSINISQTCVWTHARTRAQAREYPFRGRVFSYKEVSDGYRNCKIALTSRRIKLSQQSYKAVPAHTCFYQYLCLLVIYPPFWNVLLTKLFVCCPKINSTSGKHPFPIFYLSVEEKFA